RARFRHIRRDGLAQRLVSVGVVCVLKQKLPAAAKPATECSPPFRHRKALVVRSKTGEVNCSRRRLAARGLFEQSARVLRQANACRGYDARQAGMARLAESVGNL